MQLQHAPHDGALGVNGRHYVGGEFLPFYVPRDRMPQVASKDYPALRRWLAARGLSALEAILEPSRLRAHQRIDEKRALAMPAEALRVPCLVSSDFYMLDGNHRWLAHMNNGSLLRAIVIDKPFDEAVDLLLAFPLTTESKGA